VSAVLLGVGALLAGCTQAPPSETPSTAHGERSGASADASSGTSPVIFAFTCRSAGGRTTTYTTYAAVWAAERTDCTAELVTGSVPSAQQQAALDAADGSVSLGRLASVCAVTGTGPWAGDIATDAQAAVAAGAAVYCPGHPDLDRLQDALAAYRG
jgi:hypothetical protein